jgi:hypothetical protein
MEFVNMVRILFTLEAGWLLHIHFFLDSPIQEGTLDIVVDDKIWQVWKNWTIRFAISEHPVSAVPEQSRGKS